MPRARVLRDEPHRRADRSPETGEMHETTALAGERVLQASRSPASRVVEVDERRRSDINYLCVICPL